MSRLERSHLRIVRDPEPLGSYIRPLSRDIKAMSELLAPLGVRDRIGREGSGAERGHPRSDS